MAARRLRRRRRSVDPVQMRVLVRQSYDELEREQFSAVDADERDRLAEILRLTRSQVADDNATNDRARFGGQRTLSLDAFAEAGYEPTPNRGPSRAVREEQEALEEGMKPFIDALPMDQADALRAIYKYRFTFRDAARRLGMTTPMLQRRVHSALDALGTSLLRSAGFEETTK